MTGEGGPMTRVSEAAAQHAAERRRRAYQETLEICIDILDKARHLAERGF